MQKLLVFLCLTLGCAAAAADEMPTSLVSFAELYRLAVSGAAGAAPSFAVSSAPAPDRWMLLFAGLAAFGWVAHRRLGRLF